MALEDIALPYIAKDNSFYRKHYHHLLIGIILLMILLLSSGGVLLYLLINRPLPLFYAIEPQNKKMSLTPYNEPNLLPETILRWATKAATAAYTFSFGDYIVPNTQAIMNARQYFTENGWQDYLQSEQGLIQRVIENRLLVYSIVSGTPIIANEGDIPGTGYVWRVQMPFLVTYKGENSATSNSFMVILSIVRVPTYINSSGIGIDQFVMV